MPRRPVLAPLAAAIALLALPVQAQTPPAEKKSELEQVVVTGIRATLEKSLNDKRNAGANVDVITALEVGKMPDKNLADSLQRVPGVAVRTDYDEAEKVAMRGTNPDMSLILFNGHTVSGGDWFVADQGSSSRSTSLSLIPSSVLNSATVYKTSQANVLDGGLAGTINVTTRKPLSERQSFGAFASVGVVYADLPGKSSPQLNASVNWKNEANTLGVIGQVFKEKRYIRRDSISRFAQGGNSGWAVIDTTAMRGITDTSLNGVRMPGSMSSEFVEGVRDRQGGLLAAQYRVNPKLDIGATGFFSEMGAENYGRLYSGAMVSMLRGLNSAGAANGTGANQVFAQLRNPVVKEQVTQTGQTLRYLESAEIVYPGTTPRYIGNMGTNLRSGAEASSGFFDLDASWKPTNDLSVKALASTTRGVGRTALDQGMVYARNGLSTKFQMNGADEAPTWSYGGAGGNRPALSADGSGYSVVSRAAASNKTVDGEHSVALDAEYQQGGDFWQSLQFGYRFADHRRDLRRSVAQLANAAVVGPDPSLAVPFPSDFGNTLGGGVDRSGDFYFPRDVVVSYLQGQIRPTTPEFERRVVTEIEMKERQKAFYGMQTFDAGSWSGNIGLRLVRTEVDAQIANPISAAICPKTEPGTPVQPCARFPNAIVTAGDGSNWLVGQPFNRTQGTVYYKVFTERRFDHLLPSLNLRWEPINNVVLRYGASKTLGRQNYNVYGSGFTNQTCNAGGCTVTGPNPNLQPMTAVNNDVSVGWFYAKRSLLQLNLFDSLIRGYLKVGANRQGETLELTDPADNLVKTYTILSSSQQRARVQGAEIMWEQPIGWGFGFTANLSYADTKVEDGRPLVGASKNSRNLGLYFENDLMSVRLVYNHRSEYVASTTAPNPIVDPFGNVTIGGQSVPAAFTWAAPLANVALSANWNLSKQLQLAFSGTNLTNPNRAQYLYSPAEQQNLNSSGRQYYLELRYKH